MAHHSPGFLALIEATRPDVREVSIAEMQERLRSNPHAHLIDVREDSEWANGHMPGAEHFGKGVIERDIEAKIPDQGAELILYCGGGFRSILAADALQKMGYTNVASLQGGWREWLAGGGPVEGARS